MRRPGRGSLARALALVPALTSFIGTAPARADRDADLLRLRSAIAESRERVADYEREQRGLLEAVEALDRAVALLAGDVSRARREAKAAREDLARIEVEAAELSERLEETRTAMRGRATALYKAGQAGAVRLLFSAGGLREFLSRVYVLRLLLTHDGELIATHRAQSEALARARTRAGEAAARRDEAVASLRKRSGQLASEREAKRRLVSRLHEDRSRERAALVELETAERALEETLAGLGAAAGAELPQPGGPSFTSLRGRLPAPVDAPIVGRFGRVVNSAFQTETVRRGIEFDAPLGMPVEAVAAGTVRYAGWFRGYGRLVIVEHGERYFSVSGHLEEMRVNVGDAVAAGTPVGTVGETGSLEGPRLYFEIRRGDEPLDPRRWLESAPGVE